MLKNQNEWPRAAARLAKWRKAEGLSNRAAMRAFGYRSPRSIQFLERADQRPSISRAAKIAKLVGDPRLLRWWYPELAEIGEKTWRAISA